MAHDDRFGSWRAQMPSQQLAVPDMGSAAQPITTIGLNPGRQPFQTPADVTRDMRVDMRNILYGPKHIHLDGTTAFKTANLREMDQLIDRCFAMNGQQWQTGQFHSLPDKKDVEGGISNVCVPVAIMTNDMGAVTKCPGNKKRANKEITHRMTNRPGDLGLKVTKPTFQSKTDKNCVKGATVLMGVEISTLGLTFKFYDGGHKKMPNSYRPSQLLPTFASMEDAKLAAMKAYELFWLRRGRMYNMEIAIYVARNRLRADCQEKDLVFFFSTVSASSGPKFVVNPNRLCVAFTRMRQALIVVGDLGSRTKSKKAVTDDGQHLSTRAFNQLWGWFPENDRVVQFGTSSD